MEDQILNSKIGIPRQRPGLLPRPRLIELLTHGSDRRLTLVASAAGSGKTTLLADWATSHAGSPVAWLSLDSGDDRFDLFWTYVVAAFQVLSSEIGAGALAVLGSPSPTVALTVLLNDLGTIEGDVYLVLDDYHAIESFDIHESVAHFLDRLPDNVHILIATRSDPALPLAKLRARGDLTEIRVADLSFNQDEANIYLTGLMEIRLTPDQLAMLAERTEGWAAALQLAALSMRGVEDVDRFIADFAGTDRYIVDYLVEEVLDRQAREVSDFLLETSILDRFSGPLCNAITGREDGVSTLADLERENLLIVPLDGNRQWYRYHHLFADVLRARLRAEHAERLPSLHRRASDWFDAAGDPSEAIKHALAAGDFDRAADLVEWAIPGRRQARDEATMLAWFEALPPDLFANRPVLAIGCVGARLASGDLEGVDDLLRSAEFWVGSDEEGMVVANSDDLRRLPSGIALYRSAYSLMTGDAEAAFDYANRAFEVAEADQDLERGGAAGLVALIQWSRGELDAAFESWGRSLDSLDRAGHYSDVAGVSISMGDIRLTQGRLSEALEIYERGLRFTTRRSPPERGAADMHIGIGEVYRERNDLAKARQHLEAAQELGDGNGLPQNLYRARLLAGRLSEAEGDVESARESLTEAGEVYFVDFSPDVRPVTAVAARLALRSGRRADARRWADESGLTIGDEPNYVQEFGHLTLVRVLLATDERGPSSDEVIGFAEQLLESARAGGRTATVIEILVVLAQARWDAGAADDAVDSMREALVLAAPERLTRVFLDEGGRLTPVLSAVVESGDLPTNARSLLTELQTASAPKPAQPLVDPLTDRELAVLRLLATDLSGPEIARELYVSLNTMRTHTKSIYLKLGVGNRRAAVLRAQELALI